MHVMTRHILQTKLNFCGTGTLDATRFMTSNSTGKKDMENDTLTL